MKKSAVGLPQINTIHNLKTGTIPNQKKYTRFQYGWYIFLFYVYHWLYQWGMIGPPAHLKNGNEKVVGEPNETDVYMEKHNKRFLGSFQRLDSNWNSNIDSLFYFRKEWKEYMKQDSNTLLEQEWKRRVLIESTPRGNVIMYYDAFKEGFAYFSDQNITYPILNAVAMKYVLTYRCRDFFIDEFITPEPSPFVGFLQEDEIEDMNKKRGVMKSLAVGGVEGHDLPFVKPKSYNTVVPGEGSGGSGCGGTNVVGGGPAKIIYKNKFLYLGKIVNYSVLQKPPPVVIRIKTQYDAIFDKNQLSQKNVMDYKTFKEQKEKKMMARAEGTVFG